MSMDVRVTAPFFKSFGDSDGAESETVQTFTSVLGSSKGHVESHRTSFAIKATRRQAVLRARYEQRKMVNNSETNRQL